MSNESPTAAPELKQILGAMIFASTGSVSVKEMHRCLKESPAVYGGETAVFAQVKESDIEAALTALREELDRNHCGFILREVAGGYRFQSDPACGKWLRYLLDMGRPNRLSRPALETLAVIAYRQPIAKSQVEGIRGVNIDHVLKTLMEMQLVRLVGRSDLPGRPFLYGTTQTFLEHFGLKDMKELHSMEPSLLASRMRNMAGSIPAVPATPAPAANGEPAPTQQEGKQDETGPQETPSPN